MLRFHKYNIHNIKSQPNSETEVNGKVYFKCDLCESKYTKVKNLREHKKTKHGIKPRKKCPHCSKLILSDVRLKVHLNIHENNGVFKCWHNGCDKEKHSETQAMNHIHQHKTYEQLMADPKKRFKYSCDWPGCDYKAKYQGIVDRHRLIVHEPESLEHQYTCDHPGCGKIFKTKKSLEIHWESHKTGERLQCQHCHKDFKNNSSLKSHVLNQHTRERTLICDHPGCKFNTTTLSHMNYHKLNSHSNRSIACTVEGCDKRFATKERLKSHMISHITEYHYKCPFDGCDKAFKIEKYAKKHYKEQHTEIELLRCDWPGCDFQTKLRASHSRHRQTHKTERDLICEWP